MIGFHGCDQSVGDNLVKNPDNVEKSQEAFDWLGHGMYFWEGNEKRAMQWDQKKKRHSKF